MSLKKDERVYSLLQELNIPYIKHEHPAVYTVEEAQKYEDGIEGAHCKNIFLCDKNKKNYYLVVLLNTKKLDFKQLYGQLEVKNLRFASPEKLHLFLGLEPGAVSPLGLINDVEQKVQLLLDSDLLKAEQVNFHPNVNTATITLASSHFKKFLDHCGNKVTYIKLD